VVAPLTLVAAFLVGASLIRFGPRLGMVDLPEGELKPHKGAVVPLGGVAVLVAVHLGLIASSGFDRGLFAASALALVLGMIDDRLGLTPVFRLVVEVGIASVLVLTSNAAGFGDGAAATIVAILLVVVAINAVNLFDGLDGLVGSVATVSALGLSVLAAVNGTDVAFGIILAAALLGFLIWNWPPAKLFLGDNGSYTVGVFLAYGMADAALPASVWSLLTVAGVLGIIVIDLVVTMVRRRVTRAPMFVGNRGHLYDQLHRRGLPVWKLILMMAAVQVVLVSVVVVTAGALEGPAAVVTLALVMLAIVAALGRFGFLGGGER